MIPKLRALSIALVAISAISALAASTAAAEEQGIFTAEEYGVHLDGVDDTGLGATPAFTAVGVTAECTKTEYTNTDPETKTSNYFIPLETTTITIKPTYEECHTIGTSRPVTVTMNDCDYVFHVLKGTEHSWELSADLVCPSGKEVTIEIYREAGLEHIEENEWCKLHIPPQKDLAGLTGTNQTGGVPFRDTVKVEGTIKLKATVTARPCSAGLHLTLNPELHVSAKLVGTNELGEQIGIDFGPVGQLHKEGLRSPSDPFSYPELSPRPAG